MELPQARYASGVVTVAKASVTLAVGLRAMQPPVAKPANEEKRRAETR